MTAATKYLAENAAYIGTESVIAALEGVTDAEWSAILAGVRELGGADPGIDCKVAITHETMEDFDTARAQHWSERGTAATLDCAGFQARHYARFQMHRGTERRDMVVIDLGDRRVSLY